ncbi:MAG: glycosyltransferase family 4 protein [Candidatus Sulfotelmatobacter sp.]
MIAYTNYPFDGRVRLEAESLVKWGYEVFFLVPKEQARARTYALAGVTVKELNVGKYGDKNRLRYILSYVTFLFLALIVCTRLFVRSRARVIHVHNMPNVLVFAALIPRLFGCKVVLDLHDTVPETYQAKFGKISRWFLAFLCLEERVCCSLANRIICVNDVQREAVIRRGVQARKIATVITMPRFIRSRQAQKQEGVFRMVNHGTMSKRLGNDLIIEAAAKLVHEIPGFELHIIGGGDNLSQLLALSGSLGLGEHVYFHDGVPWDKLAEKLSGMDVGIVANRVNTATELMLPSKLIDYVVLGIPAIVPRLKAIEYYFSPDMVSYFEPEDVDSIVAITVSLYGDKARRERQAVNANKFLEENRWDDRRKGLKGLYDSLFEETASDPVPVNGQWDTEYSASRGPKKCDSVTVTKLEHSTLEGE